jgi:hypothetical protein
MVILMLVSGVFDFITGSISLEPHAVAVAVFVISHVLIAISWSHPCFAHDDDARWTSVNAQPTAGAYVFVDHEYDVVIGVGARGNNTNGIGNCGG